MSSTPRARITVAGALLAIGLAPAALAAQQQLLPVHVTSSESYVRAESLHERGTETGVLLNRQKRAAALHQQSAELRAADDPRRATCMREAALLRYYGGDVRGAVPIMARAAQSAVERGDVILAVQSFSDAAFMAHETRQPARAWELGVRAHALTASPLLSDEQRLALRSSIVQLERESGVVTTQGRTVGTADAPR